MVGICTLEMHIMESYSIKDKRKVMKSLTQRIRQRFNVSIHELDYHDNWQKAQLEMAVTAQSKTGAEKVIQEIVKFVEVDGRAEIVWRDIQYV